MTRPHIHFVAFRGDEFNRAKRIWKPDFIHPRWDRRARREIADGDTIVFAVGDEHQEPSRFNAPDFVEIEPDCLQTAFASIAKFAISRPSPL